MRQHPRTHPPVIPDKAMLRQAEALDQLCNHIAQRLTMQPPAMLAFGPQGGDIASLKADYAPGDRAVLLFSGDAPVTDQKRAELAWQVGHLPQVKEARMLKAGPVEVQAHHDTREHAPAHVIAVDVTPLLERGKLTTRQGIHRREAMEKIVNSALAGAGTVAAALDGGFRAVPHIIKDKETRLNRRFRGTLQRPFIMPQTSVEDPSSARQIAIGGGEALVAYAIVAYEAPFTGIANGIGQYRHAGDGVPPPKQDRVQTLARQLGQMQQAGRDHGIGR